MVEIEFSALSKQCFDQRVPTQEELERKVLAVIEERNKKKIKINWQSSIEKARSKMINQYNNIYTKTYFTIDFITVNSLNESHMVFNIQKRDKG